MAFKDLIESASRVAGDLSTLNVTTLTGTIKVKKEGDKTHIDWDNMLSDALATNAGTTADVQVLLSSQYQMDGDAVLFVSSTEVPSAIQAAHNGAVVAGAKVRAEIMDFLRDAINVGG